MEDADVPSDNDLVAGDYGDEDPIFGDLEAEMAGDLERSRLLEDFMNTSLGEVVE